jgi:hypothetical protein
MAFGLIFVNFGFREGLFLKDWFAVAISRGLTQGQMTSTVTCVLVSGVDWGLDAALVRLQLLLLLEQQLLYELPVVELSVL